MTGAGPAELSAIILAGGQSRRLGTDKAFVEVGGLPLLERVIARLRQLSDDLHIVTAQPGSCAHLGVQVVRDTWPGMGSLGGIHTGLQVARYSRALVVGCDMPFLSLPLLRSMACLAGEYDVVMPQLDGLLEPLHAVYAKACLAPIEEMLRAGNLRIRCFLDCVRVRYLERPEVEALDPQHLSFFNVNTPQDLELARRLVGSAPNGHDD